MNNMYVQLKREYELKDCGSYLFVEKIDNPADRVSWALTIKQGIVFALADGSKTVNQIDEYVALCLRNSSFQGVKIYHEYSAFFNFSPTPILPPRDNLSELTNYIKHFDKANADPYFVRKLEHLMIFVTNTCFQRCSYCFLEQDLINKTSDVLSLEFLNTIAYQAKALKIKTVELCGGEPLERVDIVDVVRAFTKYGLDVRMSTKHSFSENFAQQLADARIGEFGISIDTLSSDIASLLIQNRNYKVSSLVDSIRYAVKYNLPLKIKTVITSLNFYTIPELIEVLYDYGCRHFELIPFFNYSNSPEKEKFHATINDLDWLEAQLYTLESRLPEIRIERNKRGNKNCSSYCAARYSSLIIHANGRYGFCANSLDTRLQYGNVFDMTLKDAWLSPELHKYIFPNPLSYTSSRCGQCEQFFSCLPKRCLVRSIRFTNDLFSKDPYCMKV